MKTPEMNRRDFTRWTAAAFGGVVAGAMAGCAGDSAPDSSGKPGEPEAETPDAIEPAAPEGSGAAATTSGDATYDVAYMMEEPHVCRGLNTCQGKGAGGENSCAGQGACATAVAHDCHTHNECKGQGGCGEHAGINSCKGQGECGVPLSPGSWEQARAAFEKAMADAGKDVGAAPPPSEN